MAILQDLTKLPNGQDKMAAILARLEALEAENAKLRAHTRAASVTMRVNDGVGKDGKQQSGGISVFVNSPMPATMYASQWLLFLDHLGTDKATCPMRQFIRDNADRLAWKKGKPADL